MTKWRYVIVTNGNFFARLIMQRLLQERHDQVAGIVMITGIQSNQSRWQSLRNILQKTGIPYFAYKASTYLVFLLARMIFRKRAFFAPDLAQRYDIPVMYAQQVKAPDVAQQIAAWQPDLLISISCPQRIPLDLLNLPTQHALNIHSSLLPAYAGLAPYVWVLANGETVTGTSVHIMEEKFDTGAILSQKRIEIVPKMSVFQLFYELSVLGSDAMYEAVSGLEDGSLAMQPQDHSQRSYFSLPTKDTIRALQKRGFRLVRWSDYARAIRELT